MAQTEQMLVRIAADTASLRQELRRAQDAAKRTSGSMRSSFRDADKGLTGLSAAAGRLKGNLAAIGVGLTLGGAVNALRQFGAEMDRLNNTAGKLGVSVEALQELRFAAEEVGVSSGTLDLAFQRFTRRLGEARQGAGELKNTLIQYGIAVDNANGSARTAEAVLRDLANAVAGTSDEQERLRIAFKAFDSEGAALVNLLAKGSAGIDDFRAQARDLGLVIDKEAVEKVATFNREMERLADIIATRLKSGLVDLTTNFRDFFSVFKDAGARTNQVLIEQIRHLDELIATGEKLKAGGLVDRAMFGLSGGDESLERLRAERAELEKILAARNGIAAATPKATISSPFESLAKAGAVGDGGVFGPRAPRVSDEDRAKAEAERERQAERAAAALERLKAQRKRFLDELNRAEALAADDRIRIIELERDARIEQLDELGLAAQEHAEARARIEEIASKKIRKTHKDEAEAAKKALEEKERATKEATARIQNTVLSSLQSMATGYGDLRNTAIRAAFDIFNAFAQTPSGGGGGGLDFLGQLFNKMGFNTPGTAPAPATITNSLGTFTGLAGRAAGGPVTAGEPVAVGEFGREMFVPNVDGQIVSNRDLSASSPAPVSNTTIVIDARGSNGDAAVEAAVERGIQRAAPGLVNASVKKVRDTHNRNPRFLSVGG